MRGLVPGQRSEQMHDEAEPPEPPRRGWGAFSLGGYRLMESGATFEARALSTLRPAMLRPLALFCHVHPPIRDARAQGDRPQRGFHILSFKKCLLTSNICQALSPGYRVVNTTDKNACLWELLLCIPFVSLSLSFFFFFLYPL